MQGSNGGERGPLDMRSIISLAARRGRVTRSDLNPSTAVEGLLTKDEQTDFRKMAAHPEVVEQVIAESTDGAPDCSQWTTRTGRGTYGSTMDAC